MILAKAACYLRERWITPDGRTIAAEGERPFRSGTASLRAGAIPPGSIDDAPTARLIAIDGGCDLKTATGPPVERKPRWVHRRSPGCPACGAGNIALGQRGRHRRASWREERVLHADRQ